MATITITPGNSFTPTEAVTSTKLNDLGSPTAALTAASIGTADIADDSITPALIAGNAVTTPAILDANVTFAKLTDVIDDDTMATATSTNLATSKSIKAYVDEGGGFTPSTYVGGESVTLPNGLIMKTGFFSDETGGEGKVVDYGSAFPNATISVQLTQVGGTTTSTGNLRVMTYSASGFTMYVNNGTGVLGSFWQAIGY